MEETRPTKYIDRTVGVTEDEWAAMPVTFGITPMARLARTDERWATDHAAELGGIKIAGRWLFSKSKAAELLGIGD